MLEGLPFGSTILVSGIQKFENLTQKDLSFSAKFQQLDIIQNFGFRSEQSV